MNTQTERLTQPAEPTHLHLLIDSKLEDVGLPNLFDTVVQMRPTTSWRRIASHIIKTTSIDCSDVNLRNWFIDKSEAAA